MTANHGMNRDYWNGNGSRIIHIEVFVPCINFYGNGYAFVCRTSYEGMSA